MRRQHSAVDAFVCLTVSVERTPSAIRIMFLIVSKESNMPSLSSCTDFDPVTGRRRQELESDYGVKEKCGAQTCMSLLKVLGSPFITTKSPVAWKSNHGFNSTFTRVHFASVSNVRCQQVDRSFLASVPSCQRFSSAASGNCRCCRSKTEERGN